MGALLGLRFGFGAAIVLAIATLAVLRRPGALLLLVLAGAGALSGSFAGDRIAATLDAEIPVGSIEFIGVVAEDDHPRAVFPVNVPVIIGNKTSIINNRIEKAHCPQAKYDVKTVAG